MSTHNIGFYEGEAILMSTHNISFYEDMTKIIFELSSNIIKYAPYFFRWTARMQRLICSRHTGGFHGVQRGMISVDNFFVFLRLLFFALLLLYVT